jgi:hypothetical protein
VTTILLVLAIWLLINILFVVAAMPPRKPRRIDGPKGQLAPIAIKDRPDPYELRGDEEEARPTFVMVVFSVVMGAVFMLAPLIDRAADRIRGIIKKPRVDSE